MQAPPTKILAPAALARALEENQIAFLLALGRAGGGEEREDAEIAWNIGGSPIGYHNCVVRARLSAARADAAIVASRERMRLRGVPGSWHVGPSMRPQDLGVRLRAHGFSAASEPGMAAQLERLAPVAAPRELRIERVQSQAALDAYTHVLSLGFGEGRIEAEWLGAMYGRIGLGDEQQWRHYLGRLDDRPVATASIFLAAGVAGLYFVSTAPEQRGRGIGAAISRAALVGARELDVALGVLSASAAGHGVYRRLGFHDVCTIGVYEWSPIESRD